MSDNKNRGGVIKVLVTGPRLQGFSGGIQTFLQNLFQSFSSHPHIKIGHFVISVGLYNRETWAAKITRNVRIVLPFCRLAAKEDVIHINSTLDNRSIIRDALYIFCAKFLLRKKVVLQFHGGAASDVRAFRVGITRCMLRNLYKKIDHILFLSYMQGEQFSVWFPGISWNMVANYIDMDVKPKKKGDERDDIRIFLFLGRIHEAKGIMEIVDAARLLIAQGIKFKVLFCGDGPLRGWLENELSGGAVGDVCEYRGVVSGEEKEEILASADVMLLPTRHAEGFPYVLLEAMKYGLAMVGSPAGAVADVVVDGKTGFLVESGDSAGLAKVMERLCHNRDEMRQMGREARATGEARYTLSNMVTSFEKLYAE